MLTEAVQVIRGLWAGEVFSHHGRHYTVENARLYTRPERLPPIHVAASGTRMAEAAAGIGDGLIGTGPEAALLKAYAGAGGRGPRYGQVGLVWAETEREARRMAHEWWPTAALSGEVTQELPNPAQFTDLVSGLTEEQVAASFSCGPDVAVHVGSKFAPTWTPATTMSTCTRSVPTRQASCASQSVSSSRPSPSSSVIPGLSGRAVS